MLLDLEPDADVAPALGLLVERLPERGQQLAAVVIELIVIGFTVLVFIIGGLRIAENAWSSEACPFRGSATIARQSTTRMATRAP